MNPVRLHSRSTKQMAFTGNRLKRAGIGISLAVVVGLGVSTLPSANLLAQAQSDHAAANLGDVNVNDGFAELVKAVRPAVVNISVTGHVTSGGDSSRRRNVQPELEEFFRRFFGDMPDGHPQSPGGGERPYERRTTAVGSGFIIDESGLVVTNHHVIEDADEIEVVFDDGTRVPAELKGADSKTDLALLEISVDKPLPYVTFGDSEEAEVGDWVIAIGNPFGLGGTTTSGIISARGRDIRSGPLDDFIQVDASINQGNSGGPLFNTRGEVIGVNSAIYSPNGGSVGIGFAIPSKMAGTVISQLKEHGIVQRGFLGVHIQSVSEEIADSLDMEKAMGALVTRVVDQSPAQKAGILSGDVITSYDGKPINKMRDLPKLVALTETNTQIAVQVWRRGKLENLNVVIGNSDGDEVAAKSAPSPAAKWFGLTLDTIDDQIRGNYDLEDDAKGIIISKVAPQGSGASLGLREGDIIKAVDQKTIETMDDFNNQIKAAEKDEKNSVLMLIERGSHARFIAIPLGE